MKIQNDKFYNYFVAKFLAQSQKVNHLSLSILHWTSYTDLGDNRHEDFEEEVKNEDESEFFHNFHYVHCNPVAFFFSINVEISFDLTVPLRNKAMTQAWHHSDFVMSLSWYCHFTVWYHHVNFLMLSCKRPEKVIWLLWYYHVTALILSYKDSDIVL